MLLIIACAATIGQWPERITLLAIIVSSIGIICSGLALVTGEDVPAEGVPSFVLAMQTILAICAALMGFGLGGSSLSGESGQWQNGVVVGAAIGLFVGLAVSALYYGVQHLGALRAGTIRILRLPTIALFAFLIANERATFASALALGAVMLFAMLALRFSNNYQRDFVVEAKRPL
jgi:drug/metabolite transporter (DMT)-like permease